MSLAPLLLLTPLLAPANDKPFPLMVGDAAPAIEVAEWVQGGPLKLESGQIYVVEFWATWCGPCKVAIPHLNELQKKYGEKVRFIGVSVWETLEEDPYEVPQFVKGMGDKMTYAVASDRVSAKDEGRMAKAWMDAAGQDGIPTAFVVDALGKVAWIGHPMTIDKALEKIVAGQWDLEDAAKKYAKDMEVTALSKGLKEELARATKAKDWNAGLAAIDAAVAKNPGLETLFGVDKYFLLLGAARTPDAAAYGQRLVADVIAKDPSALNRLAWQIVDPAVKRANPDTGLAVRAAERAVLLTEEKDPAVLDTLGLALFLAGDVARAITVQEKAVKLAAGMRMEEELRGRLEQFRKGSTGI